MITTDSMVPSTDSFNRAASKYDDLRKRLIPHFDLLYGTALSLIDDWSQSFSSKSYRVIDLGAGTGLFSGLVLTRYPISYIRLVDASTAMLERARERFQDTAHVDYVQADLAILDLDGPWDLVISALAIHHVSDATKQDLFARVLASLSPGGLFVNVEQVLGPTQSAEERYARRWSEAIQDAGVPADEMAFARERMSFDCCTSVEDQLAWLRQTGFDDVDCSFKMWRFAVLSGRAK